MATSTIILLVLWAAWLVFVLFFNKGEKGGMFWSFDLMPAVHFAWTLIIMLIITVFLT